MKIDRLLGILFVLMQKDRVTAPYLAEKFEVDRRTISRDIEALCKAGIPVATYPGNGGGIGIAEGFRLDKSVLTSEELTGIIAAVKGMGSVSEKSRMELLLNKLGASKDSLVSLSEPIIIDLASHYKDHLTEKIQMIKTAILNQNLIEFDYYYEKGESHRQLEPYFVIFQWQSWYVFGFCKKRGDFRMFKLQRLWNLSVSQGRFSLRDVPGEKKNFDCFPDDKILVALFHPSAKYRLIETYGLNCFTATPEGLLRFEAGYTNTEFIVGWLMAFGSLVTVIEPTEIAEKITEAAREILENYKV